MSFESLQGTSIPPASIIVDDHGVGWKLASGKVYRNGVATISSNVLLVLYWNHLVFQKNSWGDWWKWDNSAAAGTNPWKSVPSPTPVPTPIPSPTTAPTPMPTPPPSLPVGETRVDFYQDDVLVNSTKLVPDDGA